MSEKRYNKFIREYIQLEVGEYFCEKCNGCGMLFNQYPFEPYKPHTLVCYKCLGEGKLDWIEKAVGKKINPGGKQVKA